MSTRNGSKVVLPPIPAKRYFTIGEVSELCGVKPHVLRYWEQEFSQLRPMKRRGNRRYYQHHEVLLVRRIRELLYEEGFTINGARNRLSEPGGRARMGTGPDPDAPVLDDALDTLPAGTPDATAAGDPAGQVRRSARGSALAPTVGESARPASHIAQLPTTAQPSSRGRATAARGASTAPGAMPAVVQAPQGDLFAEHDAAGLQWVRSELTHALWLLSQD
jgi:DNA-binding transcriptional MerR regulator